MEKEEKSAGAHAMGAVSRMKYGFHCLLLVLSRVTEGLMSAYERLFVIEERAGHEEFNKEKGFSSFEKGDYEKAAEYFLLTGPETIEKDPDISFYLGLSYANQENYERAIDYLKQAEGLKPEDPDVISEIGSCMMKLERYEEAIAALQKASGLVPEVSSHYYLLGSAYEKTKQFDDAIANYKRAIELDPRDSVYYHALGFAYETSGKHVDAIACFKKAMELDKHNG